MKVGQGASQELVLRLDGSTLWLLRSLVAISRRLTAKQEGDEGSAALQELRLIEWMPGASPALGFSSICWWWVAYQFPSFGLKQYVCGCIRLLWNLGMTILLINH